MNLNPLISNFNDRAKQSKQDITRELIGYYLPIATVKLILLLSIIPSPNFICGGESFFCVRVLYLLWRKCVVFWLFLCDDPALSFGRALLVFLKGSFQVDGWSWWPDDMHLGSLGSDYLAGSSFTISLSVSLATCSLFGFVFLCFIITTPHLCTSLHTLLTLQITDFFIMLFWVVLTNIFSV